MKISFKELRNGFNSSVNRFPVSLIFAFLASIFIIHLFENRNPDRFDGTTMFTLLLGIGTFFNVAIFLEQGEKSTLKSILVYSVGFLFLGINAYLIYTSKKNFAPVYGFANILIVHGVSAFIPFYKNPNQLRFWKYNQTMFSAAVLGIFYSIVLVGGITLAVFAVNELFNLDFDSKIYPEIFFSLLVLTAPFLMFGQFPKNISTLDISEPPQKSIRIFAQYILAPLSALYWLILIIYLVKISFSGTLPKGLITSLVLGYSIVGMFTYLFLFAFKDEVSWVKQYIRLFFIGLVPVLGMYVVGIGVRVNEYGMTEPRYIILGLGIWLLVMIVYFLFSKKKSIISIPVTLTALVIIGTYSPVNMKVVSAYSQLNRVKAFLTQNKLIDQNGKWKTTDSLSSKKAKEWFVFIEEVRYLVNNHGIQSIEPILTESEYSKLVKEEEKTKSTLNMDEVVQVLNIKSASGIELNDYFREKYFDHPTGPVPVNGKIHLNGNAEYFSDMNSKISSEYNGRMFTASSSVLAPLEEKLKAGKDLTWEDLTIEVKSKEGNWKMIITSGNYTPKPDGGVKINQINYYIVE